MAIKKSYYGVSETNPRTLWRKITPRRVNSNLGDEDALTQALNAIEKMRTEPDTVRLVDIINNF